MGRLARTLAPLLAAVLFALPGVGFAQEEDRLQQMLIQSYDLLAAGKLDQAQKVFEEMLQQYPHDPLALNNLAAIQVKKGEYLKALDCLEQALPRAKGYKVMVNRVCDVDGVCLAFRPLAQEYGNQELEPLIRLNIEMVKAKLGLRRRG